MESPITFGCILLAGVQCGYVAPGEQAGCHGIQYRPLALVLSPSGLNAGWLVPFAVQIVHMEPLSAYQIPRAGRWILSVVAPSWWAPWGTDRS